MTSETDTYPLTGEQSALAAELGPEEVERLTENLSEWYAYNTLATVNGLEMTPATMTKWSAFAEAVAKQTGEQVTFGRDGTIRTLKPYRERVREALRAELSTRKYAADRAEREAAEAAKGC